MWGERPFAASQVHTSSPKAASQYGLVKGMDVQGILGWANLDG